MKMLDIGWQLTFPEEKSYLHFAWQTMYIQSLIQLHISTRTVNDVENYRNLLEQEKLKQTWYF